MQNGLWHTAQKKAARPNDDRATLYVDQTYFLVKKASLA